MAHALRRLPPFAVLVFQFLALVAALFTLLALLLASSTAFAQGAEPVAAIPSTGETVLGWLLKAVYAAAAGGVAFVAVKVGGYLSKRAEAGGAFVLVNRLWVKAQAVVSKVEARVRPTIQKALADGKLTPDEAKEIQAQAMTIFKEVAAEEIADLPAVLGLGSESAIGHFLEGMLERAVGAAKANPGAAPASTPMAPTPGNTPPAIRPVLPGIPAPKPTVP